MNVITAELAAVAVKASQYPQSGLPEFAFVGKSNVGKSSLLNALAGRKALARTSGSPGKTRTINFFLINKSLIFVDLPGYGYAKVSKAQSATWGSMVESYLRKRAQLQLIFLLIDIRHEPSKLDLQMYYWLCHYGFELTILATKADKLSKAAVIRQTELLKKIFGRDVLPCSAETKSGIGTVWARIEAKPPESNEL